MHWRRFKWYAAAPVLATVPVVNGARVYTTAVPLSIEQIARDCAILMALAAAIAAILMMLRGDDRTKGAALSFGVLLSGAYPSVATALDVIPCSLPDVALGSTFLFVVIAGLWKIARSQRQVLASSHALLAAVVVMVLAFAGYCVVSRWAQYPDRAFTSQGGEPLTLPPGPRPPDIIHIVFDGLSRLDVLEDV